MFKGSVGFKHGLKLWAKARACLVRECREGQVMPPYWGVAWCQFDQGVAYLMPVPLNVVAAVGRSAYDFLRHGHQRITASPRSAWRQGLLEGRGQYSAQVDALNYQIVQYRSALVTIRNWPDIPDNLRAFASRALHEVKS
jgi:hypothetical protein